MSEGRPPALPASALSRSNARRFMAEFNRIEAHLRRLDGSSRYVDFVTLLRRVADRDRIVRRYAGDLSEYAELRNAIVHRERERPIAEPYDETVDALVEIRRILEAPPKLLALPRGNGTLSEVKTCGVDDRVREAAVVMYQGGFSQLPVRNEAGRIVALLTTETIARWLGSRFEVDTTHYGLLENAEVRDVLPYAEDTKNYMLLHRRATVFDALTCFDEWTNSGRSLDAILVSENGRPTEALLRIITVFDIPLLHQALSAGPKPAESET